MKPAVCDLCGRSFENEYFYTEGGGAFIEFDDYRGPNLNDPLLVGNTPGGLGAFCREHVDAARTCTNVSLDAALGTLRGSISVARRVEPHRPEPELWVLAVGSDRNRVFGIIRDALSLEPAAAKALLEQGSFLIGRGHPSGWRVWLSALTAAGAHVEVRWD
jgi:hypothetical protein